jgi:hypothetical protein
VQQQLQEVGWGLLCEQLVAFVLANEIWAIIVYFKYTKVVCYTMGNAHRRYVAPYCLITQVPLFAAQNNRTLHKQVLQCVLPDSGLQRRNLHQATAAATTPNTV